MSDMRKRSLLVIAGVLALAAGGAAYLGSGPAEPLPTAAAEAPKVVELAEMEVTRVVRQDLASSIRVSGSLQPVRRAGLNARISGTLEEVTVDVGDRVKAGDVIARFDTTDLETTLRERKATLAATEAQLGAAEQTLERTRSLSASGISSRANLDQAEAEANRLRAQLRALQTQVEASEKDIRDAVVRAEFDGTISRRSVDQGQTVAVNTEIFGMVDLSEMEVAAGVPTSRIAEVRLGQTATLKVEGIGGREFKAEVVRISPVAVANSRSIEVFLAIDNSDETLRGGMFATGAITVRESPDVIALPASALRKDGDAAFVLKIDNGKLVRQDVTQGASWQGGRLIEITGGVNEGDVVVSAPLPDLKPDTAIRLARL
jgi:RND family efflux transporter MFP subunit